MPSSETLFFNLFFNHHVMVKEADIKKIRGKIRESGFKNPNQKKHFSTLLLHMELSTCFPAKVLHSQFRTVDEKIKKIVAAGPAYAENNNCRVSEYYKIMNLELLLEQKRFLTYMLNPDLLHTYIDNFIYKS